MKRIISLGMTVLLMMTVFVGCGASSEYQQKATENEDYKLVDSVYSATQATIADKQYSKDINVSSAEELKQQHSEFYEKLSECLGKDLKEAEGTFQSNACEDGTFSIMYSKENNLIKVSVVKDGQAVVDLKGNKIEYSNQ